MVDRGSIRSARARAAGEPMPAYTAPDEWPAAAEPGQAGMRQPVRYSLRPLTLPRLTLAPELSVNVAHAALTIFGSSSDVNAVGINIGASFGITDDLEFQATFAPFVVAPSEAAGYGDPIFGLTYRFIKGDVELGARLQAQILTHLGPGVTVSPSIPLLVRIGQHVRLDTGVQFAVATAHGGVAAGMAVPLVLNGSVTDNFHLGLSTGVGILNFEIPGESTYVPVGFQMGFAVPSSKGPVLDILPSFQWPYLFTPGADGKVNPSLFTVGVQFRGYIYL
ncbi:MAG: hypothetical protein QM820_30515 [Minicystis sp.]